MIQKKIKQFLSIFLALSLILLSPGSRFYAVLAADAPKEDAPDPLQNPLSLPDQSLDPSAASLSGAEIPPPNAALPSEPLPSEAKKIETSSQPSLEKSASQAQKVVGVETRPGELGIVPNSPVVTPAKAGVQSVRDGLDSGFRRNDEEKNRIANFSPEAAALASRALFDGAGKIGDGGPPMGPPPGDPQAALPPEAPRGPPGVSIFHENIFGYRKVIGLKHDLELSRLPLNAKTPQIIDQISRQFHITRARVIELASKVGLKEDSPHAEWDAVYLGLQKLNAQRFQHFDAQKYHVGFQKLANLHYEPGWKGRLKRTFEIQKHLLGFFVRFPYHLFDVFVLGYFRQNISYTFAHSTEDFLSLADVDGGLVVETQNAEQFFRRVLRESAISGNGETWASRFLSTGPGRLVRIFGHVAPLPLLAFLRRRLIMAVASAVAMGILGALAPGVAILHLSLLSIPVMGPLLVTAANGLPVFISGIPFLGGVFAPIVAAATQALMKDLVLGPILNTFILSTIFTLPQSVDWHRRRLEAEHPEDSVSWTQAMASAVFAREFWKFFIWQDLKFFLGLLTVGSEIQGILSYGAQIDTSLTPSWHAVTGHDFHGFHGLFSAFEAPKGQSVIPFGGAITWGNVLLYKVESALGFNLSDAVMHTLNSRTAGAAAAGVVAAASAPSKPIPFDSELYKKTPKEIDARLKELEKSAGNFKDEMKAARAQELKLQKDLASVHKDEAALKTQNRPLTPGEIKAYRARLAKLRQAQNERYVRSKLSENHDLSRPASNSDQHLHELKQKLKDLSSMDAKKRRGPENRIGYAEDQEIRPGMIKSVLSNLDRKVGRNVPSERPLSPEDLKVDHKIENLVKEIRTLRTNAAAQMKMRDATGKVLEVVSKARESALNNRRNGQDMMNFIQGLSQVSAVMDFALGLREINAAENAISGMEGLLNTNIQKIDQSQTLSQQNQAAAQQAQSNLPQWQQEATQQTQADQTQQNQLSSDFSEASSAVQVFTSVKGALPSVMATIASHEGVTSGSFDSEAQALEAKFQLRLQELGQVSQWRTNGNPNNPSAFSLKEFKNILTEVQTNLQSAQNGLSEIKTAPTQAWPVIIKDVPGGPGISNSMSFSEILSARKSYWEGQLNTFQKDLNSVAAMLDPNNQTMVTDEFGRSYPQSLPVWEAQASQTLSQAQSSINSITSQMDQMANQISQAGGPSLPRLSGLTLTQLQTAVQNYGTALQNAQIPNNGTPQAFQASLDLVKIASLLPQAAWLVIQGSEAQTTVTTIQSALRGTVPQAQTAMKQAVNMVQNIINDVGADQAFVAQYPNANANPPTNAVQALINRKENLLQNDIISPLNNIQNALENTLIPYQESSIQQVSSNGAYQELFSAENSLITQTQQLNDKTIPWGLISLGGSSGNTASSLSSLQSWQTNFTNLQQTVSTNLTQVNERKDPNFNGNETVDYLKDSNYPGGGPYSLPKKITLYTTEMDQRVKEINDQDAQLNQILTKIQTLSGGKYNLSSYQLPTNVAASQAGYNQIYSLSVTNNGNLTGLASELKNIAAQAGSASSINVGGGGGLAVQTGHQPSPTVSNAQQLALLALAAAKILAPSSGSSANSPSISFSIARFLYSFSTVQSSQQELATEIPQAEKFLNDATAALNSAQAQLKQDEAYINSGGNSPPTATVYANQIAMLNSLQSVLQEGINFYNIKISQYDPGSLGTVNLLATYYQAMANQVYGSGVTVDQGDLTAMNSMMTALQNTMSSLNSTKSELLSWMGQLNSPYDSALHQTSHAISQIQDDTRKVLEANHKWTLLKENLSRADRILRADMDLIGDKQKELINLRLSLTDEEWARVPNQIKQEFDSLHLSDSGWGMGLNSSSGASALVIKKSNFPDFVNNILSSLSGGANASSADIGALGQSILANPQNIAQLIPGAQVMNLGDSADGFYLVYQTGFGVPYGLSSTNQVTLGNVAHVMGSNLSVMAYDTYSPPETGGASNAPWGDKGVGVQVETLRKNNVNYFEAIIHHDILDVPPNMSFASQANESRLLLFNDYAMLLMNGKLYVGLTGFGDAAAQNSANQPYYYGGNAKTSIQLTPVMSLNADQQALFAKDPRQFFETANLDFTGLDPSLNQTFDIAAHGKSANFYETKIGPTFDVASLLKQSGVVSKDDSNPFTVDLYYANYAGTYDITQQTLGTTILKGFTIRGQDSSGRPVDLVRISNTATGELGQQYNIAIDQLSVQLPQNGIVFSATGQMLGPADAYYAQIGKQLTNRTQVSVGYGSPFVGYNNRLSLMFNTSASLSQLWNEVTRSAADDLNGGKALKGYQKRMGAFLKPQKGQKDLNELKAVFAKDVGRRLIEQKIGTLDHDIKDLRSAGAILDNVKVVGDAGFVSGPVSNDPAELAATGGFMSGTETMVTLTKTQKGLLDNKVVSLYKNGLLLQSRLVQLTKDWEESALQIVKARVAVQRAAFLLQNASSVIEKGKAQAQMAEASEKLSEARVRYNIMAGKNPSSPTPFDDLNLADVQNLVKEIHSLVAAPDRLKKILGSLDKKSLKDRIGEDRFNIMDWIPFVDQFTFGIGTQIQDLMAGQIFGMGGTLRLPFYDPSSKDKNKSYLLKSQADIKEMEDIHSQYRLLASNERREADVWGQTAGEMTAALPQTSSELEFAIKAYRNGLISRSELRQAINLWNLNARATVNSQSQAASAGAWAAMDEAVGGKSHSMAPPMSVSDLSGAIQTAFQNSSLEALALHQEEFEALAKADNHVTQKFWINLMIGVDLTATGTGFLPSFGFTGFPILPIPGARFQPEELKELQVKADKGQSAYYGALESKLKVETALQMYQDIVEAKAAQSAIAQIDQQALPALQRELSRAESSGDRAKVSQIKKEIFNAKLSRAQMVLTNDEAHSALNVLMGRPADSVLSIDISPEKAYQQLQETLKEQNLVAAQKTIFQARVQVAKAYQKMVDKNLKVQDVSADPISLTARTIGRLISALSEEDSGRADKVMAARLRLLTEERQQDSFDSHLANLRARDQVRLQMLDSEIQSLSAKGDPFSLAKVEELKGQKAVIQASLLSLGVDSGSSAHSVSMPDSFAALRRRLIDGEEKVARVPRLDSLPPIPAPGFDKAPAEMFMRYFYARQTLDETPINRGFLEPWIELRLKSKGTPEPDLIALAKLSEDKADRLDQIARERAAALADAELAAFAENVRFLKWVQSHQSKETGVDWTGMIDSVRQKTFSQAEEIWALLGLSKAQGQTAEDRLRLLSKLVPEASGAEFSGGEPRLVQEIASPEGKARIAKILGLDALGPSHDKDVFMDQIRADVLSEHMSYQGITPIAAFGIFRGTPVFGGFLEAPDPQEIERGLTNILSDSIREQLKAQGQFEKLEMVLYTQMTRVSGGMKEVQADSRLLAAAIDDLKQKDWTAAHESGSLKAHQDVLDARKNLIQAQEKLIVQSADLKSNFVSLVAELKALGKESQSSDTALSLKNLSLGKQRASGDLNLPKNPSERGLLGYWADRMEDPNFIIRQDRYLHGLGISQQLIDSVDSVARLYRTAIRDSKDVTAEDFSSEERLRLLAQNDARGKRNLLIFSLAALKTEIENKDPQLGFLRRDLERELGSSEQKRTEYSQAALELRNAYWNAVAVSPRAEAAFKSLEADHQQLDLSKAALIDSYFASPLKNDDFILKDGLLDDYLKAQQIFDEDLIRTLDLKEVQGNAELIRTLDALYDVHKSLDRQIDSKESGRGILALDALIMLEKSRLFAERWEGRSEQSINAVALKISELENKRADWLKHGSKLYPLYAQTRVDKDGRRLWAVEGWLTQEELAKRASPAYKGDDQIVDVGGRYFLKSNMKVEFVRGADAFERQKLEANSGVKDDSRVINLAERLSQYDFASEDGQKGYSVQELFGAQGLLSNGKVLFFEAFNSKNPGLLHYRLPALAAWARSPDQYEIYVYTGKTALPSDKFQTLESLKASSVKGDFSRVYLSKKGAGDLMDFFETRRQAELRAGYAELKLAGYGFARNEKGEVSDVYLSRDDFDAAKKAFSDADGGIKEAQIRLIKAAKDLGESDKKEKEAQKIMLEAVRAENEVERSIKEKVLERYPRKNKELAANYAQRIGEETKKELSSNGQYKDAQKRVSFLSKKLDTARDNLKLQKAVFTDAKKQVKEANTIKERSKTWSLYRSRDLILGLDSRGTVLHAQASPVYGRSVLNDRLSPQRADVYVRGPIYAAVMDSEGRLRQYYTSSSGMDQAAKSWTLKSKTIDGKKNIFNAKAKTLNPGLRVSHYEVWVGREGQTQGQIQEEITKVSAAVKKDMPSKQGESPEDYAKRIALEIKARLSKEGIDELPVLLNQRYLEKSAQNVSSHLPFKKYWGVMPWRWGSLIMEVPREIVGFPVEWAGRDPRFQHYLGRVAMYKTEGGETEHHGFFRNIAGALDVLNFLPDPVTPYYDLSQFPSDLRVGRSTLMPGDSEASLSGRYKDANVHFGALFLERLLRYYQEDINAARLRTLAHFNGGVSEFVINEMQGRRKTYEESKKEGSVGEEALAKALSDKEVGLSPRADGSGKIVLSGNPEDIWVNRAQKTVHIEAGAQEYQSDSKEVHGYVNQTEKELPLRKKDLASLKKKQLEIERMRKETAAQDSSVKAAADRLHEDVYGREIRVLSQQEVESRLKSDRARDAALTRQVSWWRRYIRRLEKLEPALQVSFIPHAAISLKDKILSYAAKIMLFLGSAAGVLGTLFKKKKRRKNVL